MKTYSKIYRIYLVICRCKLVFVAGFFFDRISILNFCTTWKPVIDYVDLAGFQPWHVPQKKTPPWGSKKVEFWVTSRVYMRSDLPPSRSPPGLAACCHFRQWWGLPEVSPICPLAPSLLRRSFWYRRVHLPQLAPRLALQPTLCSRLAQTFLFVLIDIWFCDTTMALCLQLLNKPYINLRGQNLSLKRC